MPKTFNCDDVHKIISSLELVENISKPGWLKVSGEDLLFAKPKDEFTNELIRWIPEMYSWLKTFANNGNQEAIEKLREDLKTYLSQKESILAYYLQSSDFKKLLIGENDEE